MGVRVIHGLPEKSVLTPCSSIVLEFSPRCKTDKAAMSRGDPLPLLRIRIREDLGRGLQEHSLHEQAVLRGLADDVFHVILRIAFEITECGFRKVCD
jgi:hypothetical protein